MTEYSPTLRRDYMQTDDARKITGCCSISQMSDLSQASEVDAELVVDVLVIGGGMAGMTAAARACELGQSVIVLERGGKIGGSAVLSGGGLWTLAENGIARMIDPDCDEAMCEILADGFADAAAWIEQLGAQILPPVRIDAIQGFPAICRPFDVLGYLRLCAATVKDSGGWIVTSAEVRELETCGGGVCGAIVIDRDGTTCISARQVILATGGFQANPAMRAELIGPQASEILLRSNPQSDGGGVRLAAAVGAQLREANDTFYGHLIAHPLNRPFTSPEYLRFAQVASPRTLLLNQQGRRFVDESKSYYGNASAVALQPGSKALLIADEALRQYDMTAYAATEVMDRFVEARQAGAHVIEAADLDELSSAAADIGYAGVHEAVRSFNTAMEGEASLDPPRANHRLALGPPFWAMEVTPAITFPFRGLLTDSEGRVMGHDGQPIPHLFAIGADGCFYRNSYFGGLALGLIFGMRAAEAGLD